MKKIITIAALIIIAASTYAKNKENISYVKVDGQTYFGNDIKAGIFKTKLITADGNVMKFANQKIESLMHEGHMYEMMPVICADNSTKCLALMEYVAVRDGFKLYRYTCYKGNCIDNTGDDQSEDYYFVFKDGKFYLRIDQTNAASALPFFGINILS
jgi:hypothetical protein